MKYSEIQLYTVYVINYMYFEKLRCKNRKVNYLESACLQRMKKSLIFICAALLLVSTTSEECCQEMMVSDTKDNLDGEYRLSNQRKQEYRDNPCRDGCVYTRLVSCLCGVQK